jgi:hypothetical protein
MVLPPEMTELAEAATRFLATYEPIETFSGREAPEHVQKQVCSSHDRMFAAIKQLREKWPEVHAIRFHGRLIFPILDENGEPQSIVAVPLHTVLDLDTVVRQSQQ